MEDRLNGVSRKLQDSTVRIRLYDGVKEAKIDDIGVLASIDETHYQIHKGHFFTMFDEDSDVDIAGPKYYRFTTGTKECHFAGAITASAGITVELFEKPTINAPGDALTSYNRYRNTPVVATMVTKKDCTTTSDGTKINGWRMYAAGLGINLIGGSIRENLEWILNNGTEYIVKITADADNTKVYSKFGWYETDAFLSSSSSSSSSSSLSSSSSSSSSSLSSSSSSLSSSSSSFSSSSSSSSSLSSSSSSLSSSSSSSSTSSSSSSSSSTSSSSSSKSSSSSSSTSSSSSSLSSSSLSSSSSMSSFDPN